MSLNISNGNLRIDNDSAILRKCPWISRLELMGSPVYRTHKLVPDKWSSYRDARPFAWELNNWRTVRKVDIKKIYSFRRMWVAKQ
jgi:hypothetical protein